jgi:trigger factor
MDFVVEDLAPTRKKIVITAGVAEVNAARAAAMGKIRRDLSLPGFRRGKVPDGVLERRFSRDIVAEVADAFLGESFAAFLRERGIIPLSSPEYEGGTVARDTAFSCSVSLDVMPDFPLPDYIGLEVTQIRPAPDEKAVEDTLESMRTTLAGHRQVLEPRMPLAGEIVHVDYAGFENGVPVAELEGKDIALSLGADQALPDFEAIVRSLLPGEEKEGTVAFPDDYHRADLAGRTVQVRVRLKKIDRLEPATLDDAFAKRIGHEDMGKLRESVLAGINRRQVRAARAEARQKLMDALLARMDFPLPERVVDLRERRILNNFRLRFEHGPARAGEEAHGKTLEERLEALRPKAREEAERLARSHLVLLRIAEREDIRVGMDDANAYLLERSAHTGQNFEKVREMYLRTGMMQELLEELRADRALDFVYDKARITLVDPAPGPEAAPVEQGAECGAEPRLYS